jgi:type IX secretion system PorP/SprF family membrane protein
MKVLFQSNIKMKKFLFILSCLCFGIQAQAQQLPMYTLYDWNRFALNPAYAAAQDSSAMRLSYRKQWIGFAASPMTLTAGGFGQFGDKNGFSAYIYRDQTGGAYSQSSLQLSFSRYAQINESYKLSVGLGALLNQYSFDNSIMDLYQQGDPSFVGGIQRSMVPDATAGVYLQGKGLNIGFGGHQLFQSSIKGINTNSPDANKLARHYFVNASYQIAFNNNFVLTPSAMLKTTSVTDLQADLQVIAQFRNLIGFGLNYRVKQSPSLLLQLHQNRFILGYSYDLPGGALQNYQNGSHELVLGYVLRSASDKIDTDNDGVINKKDKCPDQAGPIENKGCPWGDEDGDGLTDNLDKCPGMKGPLENNGCPWSDSDGDGLTDNLDKCPNQKGDIANNGCPKQDSDGDGIEDALDNCPMTKGDETNNGCPIVTETQKKAIDKAITSLEFETGKAVIVSTSFPALDMLAMMLEEKSDWNLLLEGHTDNVGEDNSNMKLSEDRAKAVSNYLIKKGIAAERIDVKFYGETKPVASNDTDEGRRMNRRVDMKFVFK